MRYLITGGAGEILQATQSILSSVEFPMARFSKRCSGFSVHDLKKGKHHEVEIA